MSQVRNGNLIVSSAPHVVAPTNTSRIMLDVCAALVPALIASVIVFGLRPLLLVATCVISCVFFEYASRRILKRPDTISDMSAVVTGILLAYNLPPGFPVWMAVIGSFVAIVFTKQLFGGIGQNFANPAIVGRIFLVVAFATPMTTWTLPIAQQTADAITGATPLAMFAKGLDVPSNWDMFRGFIGGCLGEVSAAALLVGGIYLVVRKVIEPTIPVAFIGTVFVVALAMGLDPVFHICAGGVMLGAIFMATDYVTSPITTKGKIVFGIGCGLLTMIIRLYSSYPEGVSFAILIMNIIAPHIDSLTRLKLNGVTGGDK